MWSISLNDGLPPRIPTNDGSAVMMSSANVISCRVLNTSKTGLAFCYYDSTDTIKVEDNTTITLFADHIGLTELPVELVSDTELTENNLQSHQPEIISKRLYLRKCGVRFLAMSQEQEETVDGYVCNCCQTNLDANVPPDYVPSYLKHRNLTDAADKEERYMTQDRCRHCKHTNQAYSDSELGCGPEINL